MSLTHMGVFDQARIDNIKTEVLRRAKVRKDYIIDRAKMRAVAVDGQVHLKLDMADTLLSFRRPSLQQIATTLDVPVRYLNRLEDAGHLDLMVHNLNTILEREPKRHLVRVLDGQVDAVLSDRYKIIDNTTLLAITLTKLREVGAEVWDLRLTRDDFRLLAVAPHISGQVTTDRTFDPGDGWKSRWFGNEGDALNAAITVSNSETGHAGLHVLPAVLRRVCANFCVWGQGIAKVHLGKRQSEDGELFFTDETRRKQDEVLILEIRDMISGTFTPERFRAIIDRINETTKRNIERPTEAVNAAVKNLGLPLEHAEAILEELLGSGDKSQFGLCQAITAQVNPRNAGTKDDAMRSLFEDAGGQVLAMDDRGFNALITAKPEKATVEV